MFTNIRHLFTGVNEWLTHAMNFWITGLTIISASAISAFVGLVVLRLTPTRHTIDLSGLPSVEQEGIVFLFKNRVLLDATERAKSLMPASQGGEDDWGRFLAAFGPRFAQLETKLTELQPNGTLIIDERASDPLALSLHAEIHKGVTRIALVDPRKPETSEPFERYAIQAMEVELDILRSIAEDSPTLTWRQLDDGTIIWANAAYMAEVQAQAGQDSMTNWPPKSLFNSKSLEQNSPKPAQPRRIAFYSDASQSQRWFELQTSPGDGSTLYFASPIDNLVQAESSLKEFIGTLGKTFAQLPTGLAIFDANRRLVLFNPALIDLTSLGAEILSQRLSLHEFLDALRENQRIPEPRDYKSWRLRIAQLEAAATDGRYQETWTLPTGQTYRVTGQPHPDGAIAFLFEDISSEVSLKRRFRSELDMSIAVLNAFEHGVAVFTQDGTLSTCNTEYKQIWGVDPDYSLSKITLEDSFALWDTKSADSAMNDRLRDFVLYGRKRDDFRFTVTAPGGTELTVKVRALPQRATLMEFTIQDPSRPKQPKAKAETDFANS